jgi:hypothetical protein
MISPGDTIFLNLSSKYLAINDIMNMQNIKKPDIPKRNITPS